MQKNFQTDSVERYNDFNRTFNENLLRQKKKKKNIYIYISSSENALISHQNMPYKNPCAEKFDKLLVSN